MDPQTTWDQLLDAYAAGDWDQIEEHAQDLLHWLDRGGFPPKVLHHDGPDMDWDRTLARAGCQFALDTVRSRWSALSTPKEDSDESHDPSGLRPIPPE